MDKVRKIYHETYPLEITGMSPEEVKKAIEIYKKKVQIEANSIIEQHKKK